MTPEGEVQAHLKKLVKQTGGEYRKLRWIGMTNAPDCFVLWPGKSTYAFVEVKRPGERETPQQAREHARLRAAGLQVFVVDSKLGAELVVSLLVGQQNG